MTRLLVCVSDRWANLEAIHDALAAYPAEGTTIVQIDPSGRGNLAARVARERGMVVESFRPESMDHIYFGRGVGQVLLLRAFDSKLDGVLAFRYNRSSGISSIIREAKKQGLPVTVIDWAET